MELPRRFRSNHFSQRCLRFVCLIIMALREATFFLPQSTKTSQSTKPFRNNVHLSIITPPPLQIFDKSGFPQGFPYEVLWVFPKARGQVFVVGPDSSTGRRLGSGSYRGTGGGIGIRINRTAGHQPCPICWVGSTPFVNARFLYPPYPPGTWMDVMFRTGTLGKIWFCGGRRTPEKTLEILGRKAMVGISTFEGCLNPSEQSKPVRRKTVVKRAKAP